MCKVSVKWKESQKVEVWDIDRALNHLSETTAISRPMLRINLESWMRVEDPFAVFQREA